MPGIAVFMYGNPRGTPPALLSNLRHNKVLHEKVIFLAVEIIDQAYLPETELRGEINSVGPNFYRARLRFGYMERLNVPLHLAALEIEGSPLCVEQITYFLGKEILIPRADHLSGMAYWREHLFAIMVRNATDATRFFGLPPDQVVELGTQIEI